MLLVSVVYWSITWGKQNKARFFTVTLLGTFTMLTCIAHQQKIGLKIYWVWPCPSEQDSVSPTVSLSHQEASKSLLSLSLRGQTNENHNHRKLSNLITWTTALSNSMKLWAMPYRATQDGSWWRVLTKYGSLEKGMANHFSILALRTPWTVWKGKKIGHWKMNSPGW